MTDQRVEAHETVEGYPERIWSPGLRWLTLGLVLTVAGAAFEALAVATILPATTRELGGLELYGWAFSAFLLTNLIGVTIAGGEADRQGTARPFLVGITLFVAGLVIGGLAPTMPVLIAARALQGLGAGVIGSIAYVAIARGYPPTLKAQMLAIMSTAWVVPGLIGPALAGAIADYAGWRWVFLGLAPLQALAAVMALPALRALGGGTDARRDWTHIGAAMGLALGAGMLLAGLGQSSMLPAATLITVGAAIILVALRPLLPAGTLRALYGVPAAILTSGLLNLTFFGVDAFVPLGLSEVRGQSATTAGLALTAATLTWTAGSWLQARLAPKEGRRQLASAGLILTAIGSAGAALLVLPATPVMLAPVVWGVAGLGMGIAFSVLSLVVLERAEPGEEGSATAALQLMNVLGSALGAGIGGAIIAHAGNGAEQIAGAIFRQDLLMLGILALGLLAAQRLPGREAQKRMVEEYPREVAEVAGG